MSNSWKMTLAIIGQGATVGDRKFRRSDFDADDCVVWAAGDFDIDGVKTTVFEHYFGETIPDHMCVLSTCGTCGCINPRHFHMSQDCCSWVYMYNMNSGVSMIYWITEEDPGPLSLVLEPAYVRNLYESIS